MLAIQTGFRPSNHYASPTYNHVVEAFLRKGSMSSLYKASFLPHGIQVLISVDLLKTFWEEGAVGLPHLTSRSWPTNTSISV